MKKSFFERLRRVRFADIGHVFLFIAAILPAFMLRCRRKRLWLIAELKNEAQDNGWALFQYIRREHPECDCVYAISPDAPMYDTVRATGSVVSYGTLRHWIYYLAAQVNISSQKNGKPNAAVCYALEVSGLLKNTRAFLQHGVANNDMEFLHYNKAKMSLFTCTAVPEYEFIKGPVFGYPEGIVQLLGLCRFDGLTDGEPEKNFIICIPTWRDYIRGKCAGDAASFMRTDYYRAWSAFLGDPDVYAALEAHDAKLVFCMHRNMNEFSELFITPGGRIQTLAWNECDIRALMKKAALMVTDYSSVAMDFAYMGKPLIYYQFDYERFRAEHLHEGYFSYKLDGFGPVVSDEPELVDALEHFAEYDFRNEAPYTDRAEDFFAFRDDKNCERTYEAIYELCERKSKKR